MLSDITAVEIGKRVSTAYCGKLLVDVGATVIKVEESTGDPLRASEPAYAAFLHAGKQSMTAASGQGLETFLAGVAARVDAVLCDDEDAETLAAVVAARKAHPGLLVVALSDYGLNGPATGTPATDFTLQAEAGISLLHATDDRPPVAAGIELGEIAAGVSAAAGLVTALLMTEAGYHGAAAEAVDANVDADVSRFEALINLLQYPWLAAQIEHHNPYPLPQMAVPGLETAKDGWVCAVAVTPPQWADFLEMAQVDGLEDPRFATLADRIQNRAETTDLVRRFTTRHTVDELVELGARHRVPITPVGAANALPELAPYASRQAYVTNPKGFVQPRSPFRYAGADGKPGVLPDVGEHDGVAPAGRRPAPLRAGSPQGPLAGVRVLELGTFQAGPLVGVNLAALGADVIKVEAVNRPDLIRFTGNLNVNRPWERAAGFLGPNLGKRSLTVDFTQPAGLRIVRELVSRSDLVLDNFLPRVLDERGLDYESIRHLRPDVVMVRMPAWGSNGPWRDRPGFTYSVNAVSGLSDLTGYPDRNPLITGTIVDPLASLYSTFITLAALRRRRSSGVGGLVEVPLCDVAAQMTARASVTASATGVTPRRNGNHSTDRAPQGVYRCRDGEWLAVSIGTDEQWRALAELPEASQWASDIRYAHLAGRIAYQQELDEQLTALCSSDVSADLAGRLRERGVPAAVLGVGTHFAEHPQLRARGRVFEVDHEVVGRLTYIGLPTRHARQPTASTPSAAPLFGQHNGEVLTELGYDAADIQAMIEAKAIGDAPYGMPYEL